MRILNYNTCAERAGVVRRTWERIVADGSGPPVVEITSRRRGVLESDFEKWLLSRRRPVLDQPAGDEPLRRKRGRPRKNLTHSLGAEVAQ